MNEAKQILLKYGGNYFHMDRDGQLDIYRNFNINMNTEKKWLCEYQEELIEQLRLGKSVDVIFSRICSVMRVTKSDEYVESLVNVMNEYIANVDSYVRLRIAEELQEIIEFFSSNCCENSKRILNYKSIVIEILQNIISQPIIISEDTRKNIAFEDTLIDENLRKRAEQRLKRFR